MIFYVCVHCSSSAYMMCNQNLEKLETEPEKT